VPDGSGIAATQTPAPGPGVRACPVGLVPKRRMSLAAAFASIAGSIRRTHHRRRRQVLIREVRDDSRLVQPGISSSRFREPSSMAAASLTTHRPREQRPSSPKKGRFADGTTALVIVPNADCTRRGGRQSIPGGASSHPHGRDRHQRQTTTTYLIEAILTAAGRHPASSDRGLPFAGKTQEAPLTTRALCNCIRSSLR